MYYYIVDPQKISQREFERVQNVLYSSLSEFRISGEVMRVTGLRSITQLVENAFAHGAKTIVAVGTDVTLADVINAVRLREIVVGFIPIGPSEAGKILGVRDVLSGAKTIGLRRIEELDLGVVNGNYFLSKLNFGLSLEDNGFFQNFNYKLIQDLIALQPTEIKFSVNGEYRGNLNVLAAVIVNGRQGSVEGKISNPTDGMLDVLFLPKLSKWETFLHRKDIIAGNFEKIPHASLLHAKKLEISFPEGLAIKTGNRVLAKTPAVIEVLPKALKIIVGRERSF